MNKNIVLIGFMGVGKSTISRELSKKADMISLDTDHLIESMEKKSIKRIFKKKGEEYFRKQEQKVAKWLEKSVTNTIISTGGGFFMVENLKEIGTIVYLKASFDDILKRILTHSNAKQKLKKRPLLSDRKKARELFDIREPKYLEVADVVIELKDHSDIDNVLNDIVQSCKIK